MRFILIIFLCLTSGCISVSLDPNKFKTSKQISFTNPASFKQFKSNFADKSWKDNHGNIISFHTECSKKASTNLKTVFDNYASGLSNIESSEEVTLRYNEVPAIRSTLLTGLNDVKRQIDLLVFIKKNCNYSIMLVGSPDKIIGAKNKFDNFIKNFKVE